MEKIALIVFVIGAVIAAISKLLQAIILWGA